MHLNPAVFMVICGLFIDIDEDLCGLQVVFNRIIDDFNYIHTILLKFIGIALQMTGFT